MLLRGGRRALLQARALAATAASRAASTLVVAEHAGGQLSPGTLSTITAAGQLQKGGGAVTVLVTGKGVDPVAKQAAQVPGVGKVLVADDPVRERRGASEGWKEAWRALQPHYVYFHASYLICCVFLQHTIRPTSGTWPRTSARPSWRRRRPAVSRGI